MNKIVKTNFLMVGLSLSLVFTTSTTNAHPACACTALLRTMEDITITNGQEFNYPEHPMLNGVSFSKVITYLLGQVAVKDARLECQYNSEADSPSMGPVCPFRLTFFFKGYSISFDFYATWPVSNCPELTPDNYTIVNKEVTVYCEVTPKPSM